MCGIAQREDSPSVIINIIFFHSIATFPGPGANYIIKSPENHNGIIQKGEGMKILFVALALFFCVWAWKIRIYLKWERKKKENVRLFYRWPASVHQEPIQARRLLAAGNENFKIKYQDEEKGLAQIQGENDSEMIWCNLGICRCAEFKENHKPCKHIYKIALEKGLINAEGGLL